MAEYSDDLYPFSSAYLIAALPQLHERVIIDPSAPSAVRVFGKSMHVLAAGWLLATGLLWFATLPQHQLGTGVALSLDWMETVSGCFLRSPWPRSDGLSRGSRAGLRTSSSNVASGGMRAGGH